MSKARCFNCEKEIDGFGKTMEEIAKDGLPFFCSVNCGEQFPDNDTPEFKKIMKKFEVNGGKG